MIRMFCDCGDEMLIFATEDTPEHSLQMWRCSNDGCPVITTEEDIDEPDPRGPSELNRVFWGCRSGTTGDRGSSTRLH